MDTDVEEVADVADGVNASNETERTFEMTVALQVGTQVTVPSKSHSTRVPRNLNGQLDIKRGLTVQPEVNCKPLAISLSLVPRVCSVMTAYIKPEPVGRNESFKPLLML